MVFRVYYKEKKDAKIKRLAEQVIAYYCEEKSAKEKLAKINKTNPRSEQTKLKNDAENDSENTSHVRPIMTAKEARSYIS
jgi:tRNA G10  N-methylase Trm11